MEPTSVTQAVRPGPAALPPTEGRLEASTGLDDLATIDILRLLNREDAVAVAAVTEVLPQLASLVDLAAERIRAGGSIHYFGAGTSGRLGMLDAAELVPTFNLDDGVVTAHIAGGPPAMLSAVEDSEDSDADGRTDASGLGPHDLAIGLTASGTTPYVRGALVTARALGASTALISCNPGAPLAPLADSHIVLDTGAEVVTGSTRLKAGSAEKMALNGFSTALMVALGRTWSNLMVSVVATNAKLRGRTVGILVAATGLGEVESVALLAACGDDLRVAIVSSLGAAAPDVARAALEAADFSVRDALLTVGQRR
ncbi:N-acetylmuramic acid 6-phosphate etherase [Lacisediminihabitans sp.]|uniref:N-acetylmuramic acid 6-phosphate etherase n=1 Tax=Lacisediminihabitans sp. TaxID=2787631 RepID=UPI00374CE3C5